MIKTKRLINLQTKLKAAKAERVIRQRRLNEATRWMAKIDKTIGVLNEKIGSILEIGKQQAVNDERDRSS